MGEFAERGSSPPTARGDGGAWEEIDEAVGRIWQRFGDGAAGRTRLVETDPDGPDPASSR